MQDGVDSNGLFDSEILPGKRLLDAGCGTGKILIRAGRRADSVGADASIANLRSVRAEIPAALLVRADVQNLPFRHSTFDVITSRYVLEHVPDPVKFINDAYSCLRPSGRLVILLPNLRNPLILLNRLFPSQLRSFLKMLTKTKDYYRTFYRLNTSSAVRSVCESAGFDVIKSGHFNNPDLRPHLPAPFRWIFLDIFDILGINRLKESIFAVCSKGGQDNRNIRYK